MWLNILVVLKNGFKNEDEDTSDSTDEEEFFEEDTDKYNLDNLIETIIINGVKYKHDLSDTDYILDDNDNKVGVLKGDDIVWI